MSAFVVKDSSIDAIVTYILYPGAFAPNHYSRASIRKVSFVELFKHVQCFLYQCTEGEVPKCELYKQIERIRYELAEKLACSHPGYEKAAWE